MTRINELLGKVNRLYISKRTINGVYLSPLGESDIQILLPKNQVPSGSEKGDILEAFIYKDSEDRPVASLKVPPITLGTVARLRVKQTTEIGAFLDWELAKDLLLPFKEQIGQVKEGNEVLVALYIDRSSRLCATMHIYDYLKTDSPYQEEDHVSGTVYEITDSFGVFVAVDNCYSALIPRNELSRNFHIGETISARVKQIREDGKLTLSLSEKVPVQMGIDAANILEKCQKAGGFLPFHDKTSPEIIKREFGMSKNAFKRAIGRLMKEGILTITDKGIHIKMRD